MSARSVTNFIKEYSINKWLTIKLKDFLKEKHSGLNITTNFGGSGPSKRIALVVDYLTRFLLTRNIEEAFKVSIDGAKIAKSYDYIKPLLTSIKDNDRESIKSAYIIVNFDDYVRARYLNRNLLKENISELFIDDIVKMIDASYSFFKKQKGKVKVGESFNNGTVKGDCDIVIGNTLWDIKTSIKTPEKKIYYKY